MDATQRQHRAGGTRPVALRAAARLLLVGSIVGLAACSRSEGEGGAANQAKLQQHARLSSADAQTAAVARVPGSVIGVRLVKASGTIVYDVAVQPQGGGQLQDVQVDAATGRVIKTATAPADTGH